MPIIHEITPLQEHDFMYVADRHKTEFTYPLHCHDLCELNFVENGAGCNRIVGDHSETIGDYDLVLITSPELEHVWEQGTCTSPDIHEVTIQFALNASDRDTLFTTNPFRSMREMLLRARKGLAFPMSAIMAVYPRIINLAQIQEGFYAVHELFAILYELSKCTEARELASSSFAKVEVESDDRRILKIKNFVDQHFRDEIRLEQLSSMVGMTPSAFSRFFHLSTGKTVAEYIVDIRLGHAARQLVDTSDAVFEICFECGFNTLSNFNRLFRKRKGCSPTEFRDKYRKTRFII